VIANAGLLSSFLWGGGSGRGSALGKRRRDHERATLSAPT
jgi:hypothetical protein